MTIDNIFVVGVGRSGTSIVQAMLDSHSLISFFPETQFLRSILTKKNINFNCTFNDLLKKYPKLRRITFLNTSLNPSQNLTLLSFYEELRRRQLIQSNAEIIGDKDPRLIEHIPTLMQLFPDALVLVVVRDPGDVSVSKSKAVWSRGRGWFLNTLVSYSQILFQEKFIKQYGENIVVIRYEELISNPEATLMDICREIGVDYQSTMLEFRKSAVSLTSPEEEQWKNNITKPIFKNSENWRNHLNYHQINVLYWLYKDIPIMSDYTLAYKKYIDSQTKRKNLWGKGISSCIKFLAELRVRYVN